MVRAKFKVSKIERTMGSKAKVDANGAPVMNERQYPEYEPAEMATIHLSPVFANGDPNHENSKFWASSPNGEIRLGTVNQAAVAQFDLEKEFYVDFTPADAISDQPRPEDAIKG